MTDWGAHHVDIAQWAIEHGQHRADRQHRRDWPSTRCRCKNGWPTIDNQYNAATEFHVTCQFPNGVEMVIRHDTDNGILFEGTEGRIFVSRGALKGKPVEDLESNPLSEDAITKLYKGKKPGNATWRNFFECMKTRESPDLRRLVAPSRDDAPATWRTSPSGWAASSSGTRKQEIVGDDEASKLLSREQRKGYEVVA